jgi:4-hydroxybenzoate polyprenyltransferase
VSERKGIARSSAEFFRAYLTTMRPYLMFVSGITGVAGLSFSPSLNPGRVVAIIAASFLSYGFGQALTDCFQIDTDSISSPYRPLTQGRISRRLTMTVSLAGLLLCMTIFSMYQPWNILLGLLAAAGLALYTPFKKKWWGGPAYNSWIVATLFCMAFFAPGGILPVSARPAFVWTLHLVFFAYANFVLTGYFKDVSADRATGYRTLPVVFGMSHSRRISHVLAGMIAVSAIGVVYNSTITFPETLPAILMAVAGCAACVVGQVRLQYVRSEKEAHRAIVPVVHSYILLLGGVASMQRPGWLAAILVMYILFVCVMAVRPERSQI